jgi:hypothetical protein
MFPDLILFRQLQPGPTTVEPIFSSVMPCQRLLVPHHTSALQRSVITGCGVQYTGVSIELRETYEAAPPGSTPGTRIFSGRSFILKGWLLEENLGLPVHGLLVKYGFITGTNLGSTSFQLL